ncbi:MAG: zinc ribbon domain-containing protein [Desulfobulbaceae bacterium]|nr:zinc ribbon domain-containing protein [Desulfobulbaceae bacterium]
MPLFDFVCRSCGAEFEALVMGGDQPVCPRCQSRELDKKMSTFAFRSKGSGGETTSGGGSKCGGCPGGSCATCH